jgi:hypothetical protein
MDKRGGGDVIGIEVDPKIMDAWLKMLFGPADLTPVDEDAARWMDDGGPSTVADDGYEHVIRPI